MSRNHPTADGTFAAITVPDGPEYDLIVVDDGEDRTALPGKTETETYRELVIAAGLTPVDDDLGLPSDPVPCPVCGDLVERGFKCRRVLAKELDPAEVEQHMIDTLEEITVEGEHGETVTMKAGK